MSLKVDIEFPAGYSEILHRASEKRAEQIKAQTAEELDKELKKRTTTLWPQDTGFSRDRFMVEDVSGRPEILVLNTAHYAKAVNNRKDYPRGGANPNYFAAQRTVRKVWKRVVRRVLKSAVRDTLPNPKGVFRSPVSETGTSRSASAVGVLGGVAGAGAHVLSQRSRYVRSALNLTTRAKVVKGLKVARVAKKVRRATR